MNKTPAEKPWKVEIVDMKTNEVFHVIQCTSERSAERVDAGANINLDHERFFTRIAGPK